MRNEINDYLIGLAKKGETVKLQKLVSDCKLKLNLNKKEDKDTILDLLDDLMISDHQQGRPLLVSLVFDYNKGIPENNYFVVAEKIGLFSSGQKGERRLEFHISQLDKVFRYWHSPEPVMPRRSKFTPLMDDFLSAFKSRFDRGKRTTFPY